MALLPFLGLSAATVALVQLGALAVTVVFLKALLGVTTAIALLLGLGHVWRFYKDYRR